MKRVVPEEMQQLKAWLLSRQQFQDWTFITQVCSVMELQGKLNTSDAKRFANILQEFKAHKRMEELKRQFNF